MQVKHCSEVLQSVAAALTKAQQQHKEPVARAVAAVEAVAAAHSQLQVSDPAFYLRYNFLCQKMGKSGARGKL